MTGEFTRILRSHTVRGQQVYHADATMAHVEAARATHEWSGRLHVEFTVRCTPTSLSGAHISSEGISLHATGRECRSLLAPAMEALETCRGDAGRSRSAQRGFNSRSTALPNQSSPRAESGCAVDVDSSSLWIPWRFSNVGTAAPRLPMPQTAPGFSVHCPQSRAAAPPRTRRWLTGVPRRLPMSSSPAFKTSSASGKPNQPRIQSAPAILRN